MSISVILRRVAIRGMSISLMLSPCVVLRSGAVGPDGSYSGCSELPLLKDQSACQRHLQEYTTRITVIPANSQNPVQLIDQPNTLYIFESLDSNGDQAVYVLPDRFNAPDNIAMVGNDPSVWPIIMGEYETVHYEKIFSLLTAVNPDSHYFFADLTFYTARLEADRPPDDPDYPNIEDYPDKRSVKLDENPVNSLDFRGAGHVTLKNVKVRHDSHFDLYSIKLVQLGCTSKQRYPKYEISDSIFELNVNLDEQIQHEKTVFFIECHESKAGIFLTVHNTTSILYSDIATNSVINADHNAKHHGVVISTRLFPADHLLRFVGSTCNTVIDHQGNDISQTQMGSIDSTNEWMTGHALATGGFGLKCSDQAWGFTHSVLPEEPGEKPSGRYISRFAPLSYWRSQGQDLTCPDICVLSPPLSSSSPEPTNTLLPGMSTSSSILSTRASVNTTTTGMFTSGSPAPTSTMALTGAITPAVTTGTVTATSLPGRYNANQPDASRDSSDITDNLKVIIPTVAAGMIIGQVVTNLWYYHSRKIKNPEVRGVSKFLAITLGLGVPLLQKFIVSRAQTPEFDDEDILVDFSSDY